MAETVKSLQTTLKESVGGLCNFPETFNLPVDPDLIRIKKRIRGHMGESRRFQKDLQSMVEKGTLSQSQADEWFTKVA